MRLSTLVCLVIVLSSATIYAGEANGRNPAAEPDIQEVQRAALDYARIRPEELSSLKRRVRASALLPQFQVGVARNLKNNIDIAIKDIVSASTGGVTIGPEATELSQNANTNTSFEVKAVWALNEIIYNHDAIDISQEARYQIHERRMILTETNKLYYERQRLLARASSEERTLRLAEVTAELDAYTGGWFSRQVGPIR